MKSSSNTGDPRLIAILSADIVVLFRLVVWLYLSGKPGTGRWRQALPVMYPSTH